MMRVLVYIDSDESADTRVRYAQSLLPEKTRTVALYVKRSLMIPAHVRAQIPLDVIERQELETLEMAQRAQAKYESLVGVDEREWHLEQGSPGDALQKHSGCVDLVVIPGRAVAGLHESYDVDSAFMHCAAPVIVIPAVNDAASFTSEIVIAWNGSIEAGRALRGALPLLTAAKRVTVFNGVTGAANVSDTTPIERYLNDHGVEHDIVKDKVSGNVGTHLLAMAASHDAGLIVMGGYGHSRVREAILGGATRHVLEYATVPVLMAH